MIRTVVFDLGNVILGFDHGLICGRFARASGLAETQVYEQFSATFLEREFELGEITAEDFYRQVCALLHIQIPYDIFVQWWSDIFTPVPGMHDLLLRMATTSCRLALFSNTNELHFEYIRQHYPSLIAIFDDCFLSYRLHRRKPDAAAFQSVMQACGCPADEIAFLDDLKGHVSAARTSGWSAEQFHSAGQAEDFLQSLGVL